FLTGDGVAAARGVRTSPTCDDGTPSIRDAAAAEGVVPVVVEVFPKARAPTRLGSVHWKFAFALICGSACARTCIITPLVRLICCSAFRRVGFCCNAVRIA